MRTHSGGETAGAGRIVRIVLLMVAAVIIVDGIVGDRGLLARHRAQVQYAELATELSRLRANNARLREEAQRLERDPATIEEIARRELGLIRPGEKVFILKDLAPPLPTITYDPPVK